MAKFGIYSASGTLKSVGYPTFTGTYMKPGVLEFREIASPEPIEWAIGDYVGYEEDNSVVPAYPRTGWKYTLYNIPQVKRQARNRSYGAAFVYQNVQFYDASYLLSIVPFRDLVPGDNRVHFSTQPTIAVFTNVSGIAERIQACLDLNNPNEWYIEVSPDAPDYASEARDFSVSGVMLQGVLDKIYEVWPEVGWVYSYKQVTIDGTSVWRNVITIGGAGQNLDTAPTYLYGKGNGLTSLTKTAANNDELANRIYAYGSSRNMLSGWYRSKNIKDAESVDIEHLMLPIDAVTTSQYPPLISNYPGWGLTNNLPDAAKAFVEDTDSINRLGLREKFVYFDGTGDTEEIYPSIRNMTIAEVRNALGSSSAKYYPSTTVYTNGNLRVDKVLSVNSVFDSGLAADSGKQAILTDYNTLSRTEPITILAGDTYSPNVEMLARTVTAPETGKIDLDITYEMSGDIAAPNATVAAWFEVYHGESRIGKIDLDVTQSGNYWSLGNVSFVKRNLNVTSGDTIKTQVVVLIRADEIDEDDRQYVVGVSAKESIYLSRFRQETFKITLRQVGFDISEQAALGNGKTIHFRTGKCAGRSFKIKSCTYNGATADTWSLEIVRSEDESLSQWFPNADYPIRGVETNYDGDEFVLLDIAMPDSYVYVAELKLLVAAQEYLEYSKKEIWQYTPEIDAKFMVENNRTILPAEYMILFDANVVNSDDLSNLSYLKEHGGVYYLTDSGQKILLNGSGYADAVLVDSVTINEGESTIPTYKVTLRERKRKKVTSADEVQGVSANPVSNAKEETKVTRTGVSQYFEEDGDGNVKLKDEYKGLWANGFISSAGMSDEGGGGGGGLVEQIYRIANLGGTFNDAANDTFNAYTINSLHLRISALENTPGGVTSFNTLTGAITLAAGSNVSLSTSGNTVTIASSYTNTTYKLTVNGTTNGDSANGVNLGSIYAPTTSGTEGYGLTANASGVPTWTDLSGIYLPLTGGTLTGSLNVGDSNHTSANLTVYGNTELKGTLQVGTSSVAKSAQIYGTLSITNSSGYHITMARTNSNIGRIYTDSYGVNIRAFNSNGTYQKNVVIFPTAGVGIYETSILTTPYYLLDVFGDARATTLRIGAGTTTYLDWDSTNSAWHLHGNFYADGFVSAGGLDSGGGSSFDEAAMWLKLADDNATDAQAKLINPSHLAKLSVSGGSAESGKYLSAISYSNGIFSVTKESLPTALKNPYSLNLVYTSPQGGVPVSNVSVYDGSAERSIKVIKSDDGNNYIASAEFQNNGTELVFTYGTLPATGVTSVAMTVPTGLSVSGSPITSTGTLAVTFASGYSIPTTTKQGNWDTAYGWGDHAQAGYALASSLSDYLPLTGGTLTGSLSVGDSSHTSAGLTVYGNTVLKGTMAMANNKAIMWLDSVGSDYQMITVNSSNQFVVGNGSMASFYRGYSLSFTYGNSNTTGMILGQYGGVTIGASDLAGQAYKLYVNGASNLNGDTLVGGTFTVGTASSYKKTSLYGDVDIYGSVVFGNDLTLPNNKAIKWYNSGGSATVDVIKLNASNQVVLGAGLVMDSSGNTTMSGTFTVGTSSANKATALNGTLSVTSTSTFDGSATFAHNTAIYFKDSGNTARNAISLASNVLYVGNTARETQIYGYTSTTGGNSIGLYYGSLGSPALTILDSGRTKVHNGLEFTRTDATSYPTAYIDYDSTNHAFHIHGSIYADGFVSSGGLGTNTALVTLSGTQTITGAKTFSAATTFNNSVSVNANYTLTASKISSNLITPASGNYTQMASGSSNYVWIGASPSASSYKLYVNGGAYSTVGWSGSDIRLKTDIERMEWDEAIKIVMALKPSKWTWNDNSTLAGHQSAGLIAQEVQPIMPCAVHGDDYLALNYSTFVAPVVSTLQSHETRIKALESKMKD